MQSLEISKEILEGNSRKKKPESILDVSLKKSREESSKESSGKSLTDFLKNTGRSLKESRGNNSK